MGTTSTGITYHSPTNMGKDLPLPYHHGKNLPLMRTPEEFQGDSTSTDLEIQVKMGIWLQFPYDFGD